jgi:hypothetical protein
MQTRNRFFPVQVDQRQNLLSLTPVQLAMLMIQPTTFQLDWRKTMIGDDDEFNDFIGERFFDGIFDARNCPEISTIDQWVAIVSMIHKYDPDSFPCGDEYRPVLMAAFHAKFNHWLLRLQHTSFFERSLAQKVNQVNAIFNLY